jgi:hypothetical protein
MWRKPPRAARDVQLWQGTRICPVRRSGNDEIFPDVAGGLPRRPITWIPNRGHGYTNSSPVRHRTTRPDPAVVRENIEACKRSPDLTWLACSWVGRSRLETEAEATPPYGSYRD